MPEQSVRTLARRGRDNFLYQAEHGDYSAEDQDAAAERWKKVTELIDVIEHNLDPNTAHPRASAP